MHPADFDLQRRVVDRGRAPHVYDLRCPGVDTEGTLNDTERVTSSNGNASTKLNGAQLYSTLYHYMAVNVVVVVVVLPAAHFPSICL